jgi:serine/threonine protein kinase
VADALERDGSDLSGKTLGHYRILDRLGEGGMGVVYRAEDLKLGRQVAIRFLVYVDGRLTETTLRRFQREARAASALNQPHICTVYDLQDFAGRPARLRQTSVVRRQDAKWLTLPGRIVRRVVHWFDPTIE